MRARLLSSLVIVTLLFVSSLHAQDKAASTGSKATTVQTSAGTQYSCPMHADVTSENAGKCSKCGMELTMKKTTSTAKSAKTGTKKDMGKGCCAKPCSDPCEEK